MRLRRRHLFEVGAGGLAAPFRVLAGGRHRGPGAPAGAVGALDLGPHLGLRGFLGALLVPLYWCLVLAILMGLALVLAVAVLVKLVSSPAA